MVMLKSHRFNVKTTESFTETNSKRDQTFYNLLSKLIIVLTLARWW